MTLSQVLQFQFAQRLRICDRIPKRPRKALHSLFSRQPILDTDFADQRQSRQQFQQAGDTRVVEASGPVGCKGHDMPLAERSPCGFGSIAAPMRSAATA
jgi:hypothetical protein